MHPFMKIAGIFNKDTFYSKYPDEKSFFKDFPYARYIMSNGQANVEQNQQMNPEYDYKNHFRNVSEELYKMGGSTKKVKIQPSTYYSDVPAVAQPTMKMGGKPCYKCGGMKMQDGGTLPYNKPFTGQHVDRNALFSQTFDASGKMDFTPDHPMRYSQEWNQRRQVQDPITGQVSYKEVPYASEDYGYNISQWKQRNTPEPFNTTQVFPNALPVVSNQPRNIFTPQFSNKNLAGMDQYEGDIIGNTRQEEFAYGGYIYGGTPDFDGDVDILKKGGHWIQGAVNPKHKGYCTPMSKPTCTPRRKAFAMTMKKHHGFHQDGGVINPWGINTIPDEVTQGKVYTDNTVYNQVKNDPTQMERINKYTNNYAPVTSDNPTNEQMIDLNTWQAPYEAQGSRRNPWGAIGATAFGIAGAIGGAAMLNSSLKRQEDYNQYIRNQGLTANAYSHMHNPVGAQGTQGVVGQAYGMTLPGNYVPNTPGKFYKKGGYSGTWDASTNSYYQYGGTTYQEGGVYDLSQEEINRLSKLGYKIKIV